MPKTPGNDEGKAQQTMHFYASTVETAPLCAHGLTTDSESYWLCPKHFTDETRCCLPTPKNGVDCNRTPPPSRTAADVVSRPQDVRHVGRVEWLDTLAGFATEQVLGVTVADVHLGLLFTQGHFEYATGIGTKHQTGSYLYARGKPTVGHNRAKAFMPRMRAAGLLEELPGKARRLAAEGRSTALYRLTVPA